MFGFNTILKKPQKTLWWFIRPEVMKFSPPLWGGRLYLPEGCQHYGEEKVLQYAENELLSEVSMRATMEMNWIEDKKCLALLDASVQQIGET